MECVNKSKNMQNCNCTYEPCSRKGVCCECIQYHMSIDQLPACFFPNDAEKTYDRSLQYFIELHKDTGRFKR